MSSSPEASLALPFSAKASRTREQPISFLIAEALKNPSLINLAAGLVDPLTLPVEECLAISKKVFSDTGRGRCALQYDATSGLKELRQALVKHLETLEKQPASALGITEDNILVTTGSQQSLYLIGDVLIDPGDIVIAANPSYFVYTGALSSFGAKVEAVPMDENGMDVGAVANLFADLDRTGRLSRVKFLYCTSYYQNPTGLTLSEDRRPRLLELVKKYSKHHRILILEDAAYRELSYDGPSPRSIKSYDPENRYTIIAHTFSKPFAPGLKLGYSAMPDDLLHAVLQQKGNHDFGSANMTQHFALEALRDGSYAKHVEVLKRAYRAKRDATVAAVEKHLGGLASGDEPITWTYPGGGLYVWITLPSWFDTSRHSAMFQDCIRTGVLYVPGDYCYQPDAKGFVPKNRLRLSFGQVAPEKIEPGIQRLASVIKAQLAQGGPAEAGAPPLAAARG